MSPVDIYSALLAEEHAAIHLYGVLTPHLPDALRATARAAYDDHRRHRDLLTGLLRAASATPAPPELAYAVPGSVATPAAARGVAVAIEDSLALRWRQAVGEVPAGERTRVAAAFADEAAHLAHLGWALRHRVADAAPPFPGR